MKNFKDNRSKFFPTTTSLLLFIAYVCLFTNQGILIKLSQTSDDSGEKYDYNFIEVIIGTEMIKLLISLALYVHDSHYNIGFVSKLINEIRLNYRTAILYLIPSILYCLYNNLSFINLSNYDPTTYMILLQLRTVITGLLFQFIFRKYLSKRQWFSLCLLTIACIVKEMGHSYDDNSLISNIFQNIFTTNFILILLQLFCSCFAGVYNEYLLKNSADSNGNSVEIIVQNIFMYLDSIICNLLLYFMANLFKNNSNNPIVNNNNDSMIIIMQQQQQQSSTTSSIIFKPIIIAIMLNNAIAGIVTSFFLKNLNSILKTFASTIEIILSAILCSFIFSIKIDFLTFISIIFVCIAIYVYSLKPVQNSYGRTMPKSSLAKNIDIDGSTTNDLKNLV